MLDNRYTINQIKDIEKVENFLKAFDIYYVKSNEFLKVSFENEEQISFLHTIMCS